jgi:Raf kinase inhibitor-like YbhB/YbcL family protein
MIARQSTEPLPMTVTRAMALLLTAAFLAGAARADAAGVFTLSSADFKDGEMLAKKVGDVPSRGPNCKGDNVSPELAWSNPPDGTKSFAFTVFDPDAGYGAGFVHWVAYGIAPDVTSFAEGEISKPSDKYVGGTSGKKLAFFGGPCPPPGSPHHYLFQIVATDLDPKDLPPGLTFGELREKLKGHRKGESSLVGTYVNPYP